MKNRESKKNKISIKKRRLLVTRFSAFGDVIISVKVIKAVIKQNPNVQIIFLTKKPFSFLFEDIERVKVITPDFKDKHKGIFGLYRLSRELKNFEIDFFVDIHDVLRTKLLRLLSSLQGVKKYTIDKGRTEKRKLVRSSGKVIKPLKNSAERYADVFRRFGLKVDLSETTEGKDYFLSREVKKKLPKKESSWIGIAPFSLHKQKEYPAEKMQQVIKQLSVKGYRIFIFGGGEKEKTATEKLIIGIKNAESLIGRFKIEDELSVISQMDVMLTMDSANMHLTSLTNTSLLTIWGATHSYAGFAPYKNPNYTSVEIPLNDLKCRPCSVYGNKECIRKDLFCLNKIKPDAVIQKIDSVL